MLKRFVTYIYHYDRGTRGQNVGFIKADIRDAGCRMELQLRSPDRFQEKGKVFLVVAGEKPTGIHAGEITFHQGMGQLKLAYARNQLGASGYFVTQIQAIVILCESRVLVSCWAEQVPKTVLLGKFDVWSETAPLYETDGGIPADDTTSDSSSESDSANITPDNGSSESDSANITPDNDSSESGATNGGIPTVDETNDSTFFSDSADNGALPSGSAESLTDNDTTADNDALTVSIADAPTSPEEMLVSFDVSDEADQETAPQAAEPTVHYKRISIADIRQSLPKSNWYLCSNSFLIHGFFNYRYLMLKTLEQNGQKKCYLGVPGVYERPERTMAFMFGFPSFEPARAGEESSPSSGADVQAVSPESGVFGYWMLQLTD